MPRAPRHLPAGSAYHMLNRTNDRQPLFACDVSARRFVATLAEAVDRVPEAGLLAWCLMPNHWHLVFFPTADDVLQRLMHWLSVTHVQRCRSARGGAALGHVYQGRYRSFPIASDAHLLTVLRYVERNPLRAALVAESRDWPWSSAYRHYGHRADYPALAPWPLPRPADWTMIVDRPMTAAEEDALARLRHAAHAGTPFGPPDWVAAAAERLQLDITLRPRGRPRRDAAT